MLASLGRRRHQAGRPVHGDGAETLQADLYRPTAIGRCASDLVARGPYSATVATSALAAPRATTDNSAQRVSRYSVGNALWPLEPDDPQPGRQLFFFGELPRGTWTMAAAVGEGERGGRRMGDDGKARPALNGRNREAGGGAPARTRLSLVLADHPDVGHEAEDRLLIRLPDGGRTSNPESRPSAGILFSTSQSPRSCSDLRRMHDIGLRESDEGSSFSGALERHRGPAQVGGNVPHAHNRCKSAEKSREPLRPRSRAFGKGGRRSA